MALTLLALHGHAPTSILDTPAATTHPIAPAAPQHTAPAQPAVPIPH
jgi:hypothetical protein